MTMGQHGATKDFEWVDLPVSLRIIATGTIVAFTTVILLLVVFGALWLFNLPPFPVTCKP
jgi:hypothetical protein